MRVSRLLLLPAILLAAGCGTGSSGGSSSAAQSGPGIGVSVPSSGLGGGHFGMGTRVRITDAGFDPQVLVTAMGLKVTWVNDSGATESVHFDNWGAPVDSGPIKPGASWSFMASHTASVIYHSTYDPRFLGQLQIQLSGSGVEPGG
jgi:plastocyanin